MVIRLAALCLALLLMAAPAAAQPGWDGDRPDAHAPLRVTHDVVLERGRFLVGYRYAFTRFEGLRDGTDRVEPDGVFAMGYAQAPRSMRDHRHAAEVMYGVHERATLVATLPLVSRTMTFQPRLGEDTEMSVTGLGDLALGGLFRFFDAGARHAHASLVVSLPTGATDKRDAGGSTPYMLQAGSGTVDLTPGVTYMDQRPLWSWGADARGTLRVGEGSEGWALGNRVDTSLWGARQLAPWASGSVRLAGEFRGDVRDDVPDFPHSPAAEPGFTGGTRIDVIAGANLRPVDGALLGHRLFVELAVPLYQHLHGPQLEMSWRGSLGWRWTPGPR